MWKSNNERDIAEQKVMKCLVNNRHVMKNARDTSVKAYTRHQQARTGKDP